MRTLSFVVILVLVLAAIFVAANWGVLVKTTPLSFVAFQVEGPLGIILLGITLVIVALVVIYALVLRTNWLLESHRLNREVQKQRELAEEAESSRIAELTDMIASELNGVREAITTSAEQAAARTEGADKGLSDTVNEALNSLNAHIGYFDDKLNRILPEGSAGEDPPRED